MLPGGPSPATAPRSPSPGPSSTSSSSSCGTPARCSRGTSSSIVSGATTTSAIRGSSTSRSSGCGRRSRPIQPLRRSSTRFAARGIRRSGDRRPPAEPMLSGVRGRLTATIVALVVLTVLVLGVAAYVFVDTRLHDQTLQEAADQARFDLSVLIPGRLDQPPSDAAMTGLGQDFAGRGLRTIVVDAAGRPFGTPASLASDYQTIPDAVRSEVERGQLAYSWQPIGGEPSLVVGGRVAGTGPAVWFVRNTAAIDETLFQLRLALIVGGLVLALLAVVAARVVARGVLAPVDAAGRAARRIARGDLSARVPVHSSD